MAEVEEFKKQLFSELCCNCSACAADLLEGAFQCDNGEHLICPKCVTTKPKCSLCPQQNSTRKFLPCKLITTVVNKLCSTCPHTKCGQMIKPGDMESHKKACPWRPWNFCSMIKDSKSCEEIIPVIKTPAHLAQIHLMQTSAMDYGEFYDIHNLLLEKDRSQVIIFKRRGGTNYNWWDSFVVMHQEKALVKFVPYFRGSTEEASKYKFCIEFISAQNNEAALRWNGPLGNWNDDMKDARAMPSFSLEYFKSLANITKNDESANKFRIGIFSRAEIVEHVQKRPSGEKEDESGKKTKRTSSQDSASLPSASTSSS